MKDNEIKKEFRNMVKEQEPEIWEKIEKELDEKTTFTYEKESKGNFFRRIPVKVLAACASVCLILVVGNVVANSYNKSAQIYGDTQMNYKSKSMDALYNSEEGYVDSYYEGAYIDEVAESEYDSGAGTESKYTIESDNIEKQNSSRKLIKRVNLNVETLEFDSFVQEIKNQTEILNGYVESFDVASNENYNGKYKTATIVLRIPCENSKNILENIDKSVNILSQSENVEDVTLTYVDLESHIAALETEKKQLLAILEDAETVEDMIIIQSRLSEVRYELESYASQLKTYDNLIAYDTISLYVKEVVKETVTGDIGVFEQMKIGFSNAIDEIAESIISISIWFVSSIPYFMIIGLFAGVVIIVVKVIRKRKNK